MRTPTAGIIAAIPAQGSFLGYLCEIDTPIAAIRLTSLDVDFLFNSQTWSSADLTFSGMSWSGGISRPMSMVIGDPNLAYWSLVLNIDFADSPVRIWQIYAGATTEALPLWSGRVGQCTRSGLTVQVALDNDSATQYSPRTLISQFVPPIFMLPDGYGLTIANQRYILQRSGT